MSEEIVEEQTKKDNFFKKSWKWFTTDKQRMGAIIFLTLFVVLIIVLAALNLNMGQIMQNIVSWFEDKIGLWGIYIGVFVISIFGNFTVIFPIPYTLALVTVATRPAIGILDIFIMGLFAGAGAGLGEASAWLLGRASKEVVEESMEKQVNRAQKWVDRRIAPFIIFLFAATPLPDDAILLFIGLLGYSLWKTIIWCFLGKIVLTTGTGLVAKYLVGTNVGGWIFWAFGLTSEGTVGEPTPVWVSALTWIGTIFLLGVLMFVDWGNVWNFLTRNTMKKKYSELLSDGVKTENFTFTDFNDSEDIFMPKKTISKKETSYWQCVTQHDDNQYPDYHDLYTVPFVLGKSENVLINTNWFSNFESNFTQDKYSKSQKVRIEKIIIPKEIQENFESKKPIEELAKKAIYLSYYLKHPETNKIFKVDLLFEKISAEKIKLLCIGEREALVIRSFKKIPYNQVFTGYLGLLNKLVNQPETIRKLTYASYEEKKVVEEKESS